MNQDKPQSRHTESSSQLPANPSLTYLRKEAKDLAKQRPELKLTEAQHQLAKRYGFRNWAALSRHVRALRPEAPPQPRIEDPVFRAAVDAIDSGDLETLTRLLDHNPGLASARAEEDGEYAGAYFTSPYLLEFVAENPVRCGKLPANIAEVAQLIIDAGSPTAAVAKTLSLVVSGRVTREMSVQKELARLLVENGAEPGPSLLAAVSQGETAAARLLVELGAEPDIVAAAGLGDLDKLRELAAAGTDPATLAEACDAAIKGDQPETVRLLLDLGLPVNQRIETHPASPTPLHQAAWFGRTESVDLLLERGANTGLRDTQWQGTPAEWASHGGHDELASRLAERDLKGRLSKAVFEGNLEDLCALLNANPEAIRFRIGQWSKPPLHMAAWEGHLEIARELVGCGADVNERCDSDHACPIHFAAERGWVDVVQFLIDAGSEIHAPDNDHKQTVLGWAVCLGNQPEVGELLLRNGASHTIWTAVAMRDEAEVRRLVSEDPGCLESRMSKFEFHRTPLLFAKHRGLPSMVDLLLEIGANPNARDSLDLQAVGANADLPEAELLERLEAKEMNLADALSSNRFAEAERLLSENPSALSPGGNQSHLFVHAVLRKNWEAAEWILNHGGNVNAIATAYECPATALHFLVESGPRERIEWLLEKGADPEIKDGKYDASAIGWAEFFGKPELAERLRSATRSG